MSRDFLFLPTNATGSDQKPNTGTDIGTDKRAQDVILYNPDGSLAFAKSTVIIPASTTLVVDTNLLSSFTRLDYIISFKDSPLTVSKSFRMAVNNDAGTIRETISERLGGAINVLVDVTDDAIDAFLEITNNETYPLTMTFLKSKI